MHLHTEQLKGLGNASIQVYFQLKIFSSIDCYIHAHHQAFADPCANSLLQLSQALLHHGVGIMK
jgi:hypothetical protein